MPKTACVCQVCGKELLRWPSAIHGNMYCGRKCRAVDLSEKSSGAGNFHWRGGLITRLCQWCKKEFEVRRDIDKLDRGKYCSKECFDNSRRKRTSFTCIVCGTKFNLYDAQIRQRTTRFCSHKCAGVWASEHRSGKASHNWKGGRGICPSTTKAKFHEYYQRRLAKRMGSPMNDFTSDDWQMAQQTFNHHCAYCLQPLTVAEVEHMTPLSRGGEHTLGNIVPACRSCNATKHDKTLLEFVRSGAYFDRLQEVSA